MHVPPHAPRVPFHEVYDGDLDLALTDETSDHTRILRNDGGRTPDCPPAPDTCRPPTVSGGSSVVLAEKSPPDRSRMVWKWARGTATTKAEFGDPTTTDGYTLCLYDAGALVSTSRVIGSCTRKPCWVDTPGGFVFHNQSLQPSGVQSLKLVAGGDGSAREIFNGKGPSLALPDPGSLTGPIDVQLRRSGAVLCWGARFSAPFQKVGGGLLKDMSD